MGEELPDGTVQGYTTKCPDCGDSVACNIQGNIHGHGCDVVKRTPEEWAKRQQVIILDPDGWRFQHMDMMPKDYSEPIFEKEFNIRKMWSTIQPLEGYDHGN